MLRIGCHLSSAKGFLAMGKEAVGIGANTFQFFTRNPRGGKAKALDTEDIAAYLAYAQEHGIAQILAHAPYTLNACAKDEGIRQFAYNTMRDDLERLEYIPDAMYNFHPGSHVKQGAEAGIAYIADMLDRIQEHGFRATILLETMAGKGTEIGRNFEELQAIIERVADSSRIGVCMDTCHVFDGGYDITSQLEQVLEEFYGIVDLGGKILDVVVEHELYGQIAVDLIIASRQDAEEFYQKMRENRAKPLKELTEDVHYHTIVAKDAASMERIERVLEEKGFLLAG